MVQAERFVSRLPLYRPQKRVNEVRPYGRQNKPLQRYCAAVAAAVRAKKFIQFSRADNIRPYTIVLICNIAIFILAKPFRCPSIPQTTNNDRPQQKIAAVGHCSANAVFAAFARFGCIVCALILRRKNRLSSPPHGRGRRRCARAWRQSPSAFSC